MLEKNVISNEVTRNEKSYGLDFSLSVEMTVNSKFFILKVDKQSVQRNTPNLS